MPVPPEALTRALAMLAGLRPSVEQPPPKRRPQRGGSRVGTLSPTPRPPRPVQPSPYGAFKE